MVPRPNDFESPSLRPFAADVILIPFVKEARLPMSKCRLNFGNKMMTEQPVPLITGRSIHYS